MYIGDAMYIVHIGDIIMLYVNRRDYIIASTVYI